MCRGDITKEKLLEAAQCPEDTENEDGSRKDGGDAFEDVTVDVSSTKINAVLRQLEISKLKGTSKNQYKLDGLY